MAICQSIEAAFDSFPKCLLPPPRTYVYGSLGAYPPCYILEGDELIIWGGAFSVHAHDQKA